MSRRFKLIAMATDWADQQGWLQLIHFNRDTCHVAVGAQGQRGAPRSVGVQLDKAQRQSLAVELMAPETIGWSFVDPTATAILADLERSYVEALNAVLASGPGPDNDADVNRWRGQAEAYRQACERIRAALQWPPVNMAAKEWRAANGVYSTEYLASLGRQR